MNFSLIYSLSIYFLLLLETSDNPENIKRRIDAVSTIQTKLEKFGNMLGHGNLDEQEGSQESCSNPRDCVVGDVSSSERQSSDDTIQ